MPCDPPIRAQSTRTIVAPKEPYRFWQPRADMHISKPHANPSGNCLMAASVHCNWPAYTQTAGCLTISNNYIWHGAFPCKQLQAAAPLIMAQPGYESNNALLHQQFNPFRILPLTSSYFNFRFYPPASWLDCVHI